MVDRAVETLLRRIARSQHGVFSDKQALATGTTRRQITYRVQVGLLLRPAPGVLAIPGTPDTWHKAAWTAICWAGEGAALSHAAAARLRHLDGFGSAGVEISITRHKQSQDLPFKVHRVDKNLLDEIDEVDGLPVTSARRTVLDLAGQKHRRTTRVLIEIFRRQEVDAACMWLYVEKEFQRGRRGIAILREELKRLTGTEHLTKTFMEAAFMRKVAESHLPFPTPQFPIDLPSQRAYFDFAYPDRRFAIELDGRAWHDGLVASNDARRETEATMLGWTVQRFTWAQIMYDWPYVEGVLRHFLKLAPESTLLRTT